MKELRIPSSNNPSSRSKLNHSSGNTRFVTNERNTVINNAVENEIVANRHRTITRHLCVHCRSQLSQISPGARLWIAGIVFRGARPGFLGQASVSLNTRERRPGALRRVIAALQLIIITSLLILVLVAV